MRQGEGQGMFLAMGRQGSGALSVAILRADQVNEDRHHLLPLAEQLC